ncbi:MAG: hypothetical protein CH6_0117 [Candidatus Kapaibacterium sp.]|nr:MAG: hypothetical protein CH6_0117 [Candidatus Kapabacteria bacterium]
MEINKAENWVSFYTGYPASIKEYTGMPFNFHLDSYTLIERKLFLYQNKKDFTSKEQNQVQNKLIK